jgi:anti-sigma factor RsiW
MTDPLYHRLQEASWRRALSEAEQAELKAWLDAHPEAQSDWQDELTLTEGLARLPDAPLSSNFTARVLQAVELEKAATARSRAWIPSLWSVRWGIRGAAAALVLVTATFAVHHHRVVERRNLANSLAVVANVSSMPSPRILEDFEAIRVMTSTPPADEQLLSLLQ